LFLIKKLSLLTVANSSS